MSQATHHSKAYVGHDKAVVEITRVPDPFYWERVDHAKKMGVDPMELGDYPDYDVRIDMDYDPCREDEYGN